jgi:hypothetical protein
MPIIPRPYHWLADYVYIPVVLTAPETLGFRDQPAATTLCRVFSGTVLLYSLFTRAEWGAVRVLPYRAHVAFDFGSGVVSLAAPWAFGFAHHRQARNTFLAMGVTGLLAGVLSGVFGGAKEMPKSKA